VKNYKIAIVVGSIRKDSLNEKLGKAIASMLPDGFEAKFIEIGDLPLYNQDDDYNPAPAVARLRQDIKASDAVIFITPEYNRSIPGILKNAIDHASRPWGESVWKGKPAGVIGGSPGVIGTALAQHHLRNILAALNMPTMGQPEAYLQFYEGFFDEQGAIHEKSRGFVQTWVDTFVSWVKAHAQG